MNNLIKFLAFLIYSTVIFFLPNSKTILIPICINLFAMIILRKKAKSIMSTTLKVLPFILFTFTINCWLDTYINAIWIGIKLLIVCNMTVIYSRTTSVNGVAETIKLLCTPLKIFGVNTDDIKIMVCISLSMIPILKKDLNETRDACKAKNMRLNLRNTKYIIASFFITLLKRVNQIEDSLIAKGYKG